MSRAGALVLLLWILALGLAGWTLGMLPLATLRATLTHLPGGQVALWVALNACIVALGVWRWQVLARLLRIDLPFRALLAIRQGGQAVSFLTPGPQFGGEPLQLYWLYRAARAPLHRCTLALLMDRFLELLTNFFVLFLGVLLLIASGSVLAHWGGIVGVLGLALLALLLGAKVLLGQPRWLLRRLEGLADFWRNHARLRNIDSDWGALGSDLRQAVDAGRRGLLRAALLSGAGWAGLLAELWLLLQLCRVDVSLQGFVLVVVALRLAMLLPLPGGIGTVEAALFWSFHGLGLPTDAVLPLIALMRLRDAVVLLGGLWALHSLQRPAPQPKARR